MSSPIDGFLNWYCSLSESYALEVAKVLGSSMPGYEVIDMLDSKEVAKDKFIGLLNSAKQRGRLREVAVVISLREFIYFYFIEARFGDLEDGDFSVEGANVLPDWLAGDVGVMQARDERKAMREKWDQLVADFISNERLKVFMKKSFMGVR